MQDGKEKESYSCVICKIVETCKSAIIFQSEANSFETRSEVEDPFAHAFARIKFVHDVIFTPQCSGKVNFGCHGERNAEKGGKIRIAERSETG